MCNREEVLGVICDYIEELKSSNRNNCMTPERPEMGTCKCNCEECFEEYWYKFQEELMRKCGVSDES